MIYYNIVLIVQKRHETHDNPVEIIYFFIYLIHYFKSIIVHKLLIQID